MSLAPVEKRPPRRATLQDLLALPEEERWELVDGELIQKEAAGPKHSRAHHRFGQVTAPYDRKPGGPPDRPGGWMFLTEPLVSFDEPNARMPDVAGWKRERLPELPDDGAIQVLPDWICEILSSNKRNDLITKKRLYHRCKIPHYWILDPKEESLSVHRWTPDGYLEVLSALRGERVRAEPFDAVELQVGVLFGDDEE